MTTLGAKPNHAFFHCQHPARKKITRRTSAPRRTRRRSSRAPLSMTCSRRTRRSARAKKNIFFPAVLFAACDTHRVSTPIGDDGDDAHPTHVPASERSAFVLSSNGRFFVSHNPDCAKVRELFDTFRGAEATHRMCRDGVERRITTRSGTRPAPAQRHAAFRIRIAHGSKTASRRT